MSSVPNLTLAILGGKCPRCRTGNLFQYPIYHPTRFLKTNVNCPHCGIKFEVETGFFWGAMYFSYALNAGMFLVLCGILYYFFDVSEPMHYILAMAVASVLTLPVFSRYSRILMLYVGSGISFDPQYLDRKD